MLHKLSSFLHPFRTLIRLFHPPIFRIEETTEEIKHQLEVEIKSEVRRNELIRQTLTTQSMGISDRSYVEGRQIIVSLTTHGHRIYEVFQAIESIMQGTWKPNKIVLWLSEQEFADQLLPETLIMQQNRGLEIFYVEDLGPHTKLIPALQNYPEDVIITIDDDIYYAYDMVENLVKAYLQDPVSIQANRVSIMQLDDNHQLKSYFNWTNYSHPQLTTANNFIIGSEGCLYPPHCFSAEVFNAAIFRKLCPYADDVWFTAMAILNQTPVCHLYTHYERGCAGSIENFSQQSNGLVVKNEHNDGYMNNKQVKDVFCHYNLIRYLHP